MPKGELRDEMIALLRQGHNKHHPRTRGVDRRGQITNMTRIDLGSMDIQERFVLGHWEGDHIKGSSNHSQVGALVERKTHYVALYILKMAQQMPLPRDLAPSCSVLQQANVSHLPMAKIER